MPILGQQLDKGANRETGTVPEMLRPTTFISIAIPALTLVCIQKYSNSIKQDQNDCRDKQQNDDASEDKSIPVDYKGKCKLNYSYEHHGFFIKINHIENGVQKKQYKACCLRHHHTASPKTSWKL